VVVVVSCTFHWLAAANPIIGRVKKVKPSHGSTGQARSGPGGSGSQNF
jgi:hypothetical protein